MSVGNSRESESSFQIFHLEVRLPAGSEVSRRNLRSLMAALGREADWLDSLHRKKLGFGLAPHERDILLHYLAERVLKEVESDGPAEGAR